VGSISVDFARMVGHVKVVGMGGRINVSEVGAEVGVAVEGLSVGDGVGVGLGVGDFVCTFVGALDRDENKFVDPDELVKEEVVSFPTCHGNCELFPQVPAAPYCDA